LITAENLALQDREEVSDIGSGGLNPAVFILTSSPP